MDYEILEVSKKNGLSILSKKYVFAAFAKLINVFLEFLNKRFSNNA